MRSLVSSLGSQFAKVGLYIQVYALTRSRADELRAAGLIPVTGDVTDPASLGGLPRVDTVLYAVGFDRGSGRTRTWMHTDCIQQISGRAGARQISAPAHAGVSGGPFPYGGNFTVWADSPNYPN